MITHLVIHHPHPEYRAAMLASMRRVNTAAEAQPGLVRIHAWSEAAGDRLVGIATWESMDAFQAARAEVFAVVEDDPFDVWSAKPSEGMILEE